MEDVESDRGDHHEGGEADNGEDKNALRGGQHVKPSGGAEEANATTAVREGS